MMTIRQMQRLWNDRRFNQLTRELLAARVESSPRLVSQFSGATPAAAIALIRMDELSQSRHPLAQQLLHRLIASQGADGGWDDPLTGALCLRALMTAQGQGIVIQRGLDYLANLQKPDGAWPREPLRRMPADALVSAFVLLQLGNSQAFRQTVRFDAAVAWLEQNSASFDGETAKLWNHAAIRLRASAMQFN